MHSIDIISEDTLLVSFDGDIASASKKVTALAKTLQQDRTNIIDLVPAYASLSLVVDLNKTLPQKLLSTIEQRIESINQDNIQYKENIIEIPCYYHSDVALDLNSLAEAKKLSVNELIEIHSREVYHVYAIGFSPGFPYLGFVDDKIAAPRLATPRTKIAKGSVGIADKQTGIYSNTSPGGWNIIGHCPIDLFTAPQKEGDPAKTLLRTGDRVKFAAIGRERYISLGGKFEE